MGGILLYVSRHDRHLESVHVFLWIDMYTQSMSGEICTAFHYIHRKITHDQATVSSGISLSLLKPISLTSVLVFLDFDMQLI